MVSKVWISQKHFLQADFIAGNQTSWSFASQILSQIICCQSPDVNAVERWDGEKTPLRGVVEKIVGVVVRAPGSWSMLLGVCAKQHTQPC